MKELLIVVDMQNDFIDGSLGTQEARETVQAVLKKIGQYEAEGKEVVYTMDTHGEDYLETQEGRNLPAAHCIRGTHGWQLWPEIGTHEGERFEKGTFGSMDLAQYVADGGYDRVELVGLCTDICVISNALVLKAASPELPIFVDSNCCAGVTPQRHSNALNAMKMCQIIVT